MLRVKNNLVNSSTTRRDEFMIEQPRSKAAKYQKQRCHSGSPLAGIQPRMKRLWIPAQQTAGMTYRGMI